MLPINNISQKSTSFFESLPFFTRTLGVLTIIIYILQLFFPFLEDYLVNEPEKTIVKYQLWRIGISFFSNESIIPLIISLTFFIFIFSEFEKKQGSVYFILSFYMDLILIQSLFCIASFFIWKLSNVKFYSIGLYSIILMRIAYTPSALPTQKYEFLKHIQKIPHKYFSSLVFLLFSFTNKFNVLDLFCGILIAFMVLKLEKSLKNQKIFDKLFNEQLLLEIEETIFKSVKNQEQFVKVETVIRGMEEGDYQVFDNDTLNQETINLSSQSQEYQQIPKEQEIKEVNPEEEQTIQNQ